MPSYIRNAISDILYSVSSWFLSLGDRFYDAGNWAHDIPAVGPYIASALYSVTQYCYNIYSRFASLRNNWLSLCNWLDAVWDRFGDIWDDLSDLWNYAQITLRNLIDDALDLADDAWDEARRAYNKARDAWNYATGYLIDLVIDAYNKAVWAYNQIAPAVTTKAQEIYAWVKGIPAEISDYIAGVVSAIGAVTVDIVQTLINTALAAIAAPVNLINLWFDDIQSFFNSPLDWLADRFENWFFGPEK